MNTCTQVVLIQEQRVAKKSIALEQQFDLKVARLLLHSINCSPESYANWCTRYGLHDYFYSPELRQYVEDLRYSYFHDGTQMDIDKFKDKKTILQNLIK